MTASGRPGATGRPRTRTMAPGQLQRHYARMRHDDPDYRSRSKDYVPPTCSPLRPWRPGGEEWYCDDPHCHVCEELIPQEALQMSSEGHREGWLTDEIGDLLSNPQDRPSITDAGASRPLPAAHAGQAGIRHGRKVRRLDSRPTIHDALYEHSRLIRMGVDIGEEGDSHFYYSEQNILRQRVMAELAHEADVMVLRLAVSMAEDPSQSLKIAVVACLFSPFWVRRPRDWQPGGRVPLLDHLFCYHPVPRFLCHPWRSLDDLLWTDYGDRESGLKWSCWFILMGWGASLKMAARRFEWSIPKGFLQSMFELYPPRDVTPPEEAGQSVSVPRSAEEIWFGTRLSSRAEPYPWNACMHAEIKRLGGSEADIRRLSSVRSFLIDPTRRNYEIFSEFWYKTARWMIKHSDAFTDEESRHIVVWAYHEHIESRQRRFEGWDGLAPHEREQRVREERLFSWSGRRPASVLTLSRTYTELRQRGRYIDYRWTPRGWDWQTASPDGTAWSFHELTTGEDLADEGRALRHCVTSYAPRCRAGHSAIVSLRKSGEPCVTIEVEAATLSVVHARGMGNRDATPLEVDLIRRWEDEVVRQKK